MENEDHPVAAIAIGVTMGAIIAFATVVIMEKREAKKHPDPWANTLPYTPPSE